MDLRVIWAAGLVAAGAACGAVQYPWSPTPVPAVTLTGDELKCSIAAFNAIRGMKIDSKLKDMSLYNLTFWRRDNHELVLVVPRNPTTTGVDTTISADGVFLAFEVDPISHKILRSYMPTASEVPSTVGTGGQVPEDLRHRSHGR